MTLTSAEQRFVACQLPAAKTLLLTAFRHPGHPDQVDHAPVL